MRAILYLFLDACQANAADNLLYFHHSTPPLYPLDVSLSTPLTLALAFLQVTKDCIINGHPYKKFSTGNVRTLAHGTRQTDTNLYAEEVSEVMREFHQQYYRPQHMALSLVGPQV